jgi:hypothetical protein
MSSIYTSDQKIAEEEKSPGLLLSARLRHVRQSECSAGYPLPRGRDAAQLSFRHVDAVHDGTEKRHYNTVPSALSR